MNVLNKTQIERIHAATLEVLERTGVKITHPKAREIFSDAGAHVDGNRVRIPPQLIEESLEKAPARLTLGNRGGEQTLVVEGNRSWFGASLDGLYYLDPDLKARRPLTSEDCRTIITLSDALPNYAWGMTFGLADDVPADLADRIVARQALTGSKKPLVFCCKDINSLRDIHEMAVVMAGDAQRFISAPSAVFFMSPISPLVHAADAIEKMIFCAERGIPQVCYPGIQAGSTSPMSFAGTIVQAGAEILSGLALVQLIRPGAPIILGAFASVMDMRTTIFSYGAPELSLMVAAMAQMAQHYRVPFFGTAGCTDAKFPDAQAAAEAACSSLSSALSGANLIHDCGLMENGLTLSPSFTVLVNEILDMVLAYMGGIPVNEETLTLDLIDRVGPGGHYLEEDHTLEHYPEVWYSTLFDRKLYDDWLKDGAKDLEQRLRDKTFKLMQHQPEPLPEDVITELDRMAKHWR